MSAPTVLAAAADPLGLSWHALGVRVRLVVTDPGALHEARDALADRLDALDRACSRFRDDSEIVHLDAAAGRPASVGPLLATVVSVALQAARQTEGDLDPTLGHRLAELGYDRTFAEVAPSGPALPAGIRVSTQARATWRDVRLDAEAGTLEVPVGVRLDVGATAKAWAADTAARALADEFGCGVLIGLGGDLASAGPPPDGAWPVAIQQLTDDEPAQVIDLVGGGLATSGTGARRWLRGGEALHHVLDPRTGMPARTPWRAVTVAASSCLAANVATTTTIVRGDRGLEWLEATGLAARLVAEDGSVVRLGGWPVP
jgi:thiamine biosynthesis lipoprotein